jgi:hypothetical protein
MSSSKGNCNSTSKLSVLIQSTIIIWIIYLTDIVVDKYPTPGHLEKISQLSISDDFCGVAEIDVIAAAVSTS